MARGLELPLRCVVDDEDDQQLAKRVGAPGGDRAAEAELARRFAPRIRGYGLRHLRDAAAADDLVQEVLVLTLEKLRGGRVNDLSMLGSFVLGTCRLAVRNERRTAERRREILARFPAEESAPAREPSTPTSPDLSRCLMRLSERERSVIALTYYAGRDSKELACELGLSIANVRVIKHRAINKLFACLENGGAG